VPRALATLLLVCAGLSGCLGYGDKDVVADVIEQTYTKRDVADCEDRETRRFLEQTTFIEGAGAVLMCRTIELKSSPAQSVVVTNVRVTGSTASAQVVLHGGDADGQSQTVRLIKDPNGWKLDRLTALHINRRAFDASYRRMLLDSPVPLNAATRDCLERSTERLSTREIERAIVTGNPSAFMTTSSSCFAARTKSR
jgi:hypothetical protein